VFDPIRPHCALPKRKWNCGAKCGSRQDQKRALRYYFQICGAHRKVPHQTVRYRRNIATRRGGSVYYRQIHLRCGHKGHVKTRRHVPEPITALFARMLFTVGFLDYTAKKTPRFETLAPVSKWSAGLNVACWPIIAD
jgi:hypothetical protein